VLLKGTGAPTTWLGPLISCYDYQPSGALTRFPLLGHWNRPSVHSGWFILSLNWFDWFSSLPSFLLLTVWLTMGGFSATLLPAPRTGPTSWTC